MSTSKHRRHVRLAWISTLNYIYRRNRLTSVTMKATVQDLEQFFDGIETAEQTHDYSVGLARYVYE